MNRSSLKVASLFLAMVLLGLMLWPFFVLAGIYVIWLAFQPPGDICPRCRYPQER